MADIIISSTLAGLATALGGIIVILFGKPRPTVLSALLGLAAGVMTGVVLADLLPSSLAYGSPSTCITGSFTGLIIMYVLERLVVKTSPFADAASRHHWISIGYFIAIAIAMHDFPEGLAIGAGYFAEPGLGLLIAVAIGLHNIPEGIGMAAPLWMGGMSPWRILGITLLTSLCTPIGAMIGLLFLGLSTTIIAFALALAAGAMVYVVVSELLPQLGRLHLGAGLFGIAFGLGLVLIAL